MFPDTLVFGVTTFLLVLGPLIILHELGHLVAARFTGTKVVEFGFGFPPRAAALWTGRTRVAITAETRFEELGGPADLAPGEQVHVVAERDARGSLRAVSVSRKDRVTAMKMLAKALAQATQAHGTDMPQESQAAQNMYKNIVSQQGLVQTDLTDMYDLFISTGPTKRSPDQ